MLRWLEPLRRAADDGDREAGNRWVEYAHSWYRANPPGKAAAPYGWKDMVDGIRAMELSVATPFLSATHPTEVPWVVDSLQQHIDWLSDSTNIGHSNHALNQHMGLFVAGSVLDDPEAQTLAVSRLERLFSDNYDDQGINAEGAIIYHLLNYRWWKEVQGRLNAEGYPIPEAFAVLDEAPEALAHATKPDGHFVNIGDTDAGRPTGINSPYTQYVTTKGAEGEPPPDPLKVYRAGYIYGRSGWGEHERSLSEETFFSVSFGAANRVHGHADGASLTYSANTVEWLRDPGKYQYGTSDMRSFCLARSSHNVAYIDGQEYNTKAVVPLTRNVQSPDFYEFEFVDTGYGASKITRRIIYSIRGEYMVVIDRVNGPDEQTAIQNWQLGPNVRAKVSRGRVDLTSKGRRAALVCLGNVPHIDSHTGSQEPINGWVSTGWKSRQPATSLKFIKTGPRFRFVTVLCPSFSGEPPVVRRIDGGPEGALVVEVDNGAYKESISITDSGVQTLDKAMRLSSLGLDTSTLAEGPTRASRKTVLNLIDSYRKKAWASPNSSSLLKLATEFRSLLDSSLLTASNDFGARALLADLGGIDQTRFAQRAARTGIVNWHNDPHFAATRDNFPTVSFEKTSNHFSVPRDERLLTLDAGGLVIPALFSPARSDTLTVMLHGAIDRTRVDLPLFQRLRFQKSMDTGSILALSDPTLDLASDLRLGWYLGTENVDLPEVLAAIISNFVRSLSASKIVIVGGSGGGFAALQIAAHLRDALPVAMNPQTDLLNYSPRFTEAAVSSAFGMTPEDAARDYPERLSVMKRFEMSGTPHRAVIVSNPQDRVHVKKHISPLLAFDAASERSFVHLIERDLGPGHRSPNNEQYREIMRTIYEAS